MTDWVRLWHDMPTDPKWRTIARKSGQPLPCVIALFNLLMVNASANAEERGTLKNWSDEDAAAALDMEVEDVMAIAEAMQGKVLEGTRLTGWERRQPKRDDTSNARVSAFRERQRSKINGNEQTALPGSAVATQGNSPVTHGNAPVTQCNAPETETETETELESENHSLDQPEAGPARSRPPRREYSEEFEAWWLRYPRKEGKTAAYAAYQRAKKRIGPGAVVRLDSAVRAFSTSCEGKEMRYIPHPRTWLDQGRYDDPPLSQIMPPAHMVGRNRFGMGG
jgi:hypothetical protein